MKPYINSFILALIFTATAISAVANDQSKKPLFLPGVSSKLQNDQDSAYAPPPNRLMPIAPRPGDGMRISPPSSIVGKQEAYYANKLTSLEQFQSFARLSEGLIRSAAVKFLIDNTVKPAQIYFINGNFKDNQGKSPDYTQFHYYFAQKALNRFIDDQEFNNSTYFTNDLNKKNYIAGTLQSYERNKDSILGIQFYPQDYIAEETLAYALKIVREAIDFDAKNLSFIAYGTQQTATKIRGDLESLQIKALTVEQIYAGIPYIPMHTGTTYGNLRILKSNENLDELDPRDIPVFTELPLDLSVVAGVITTVVQDAGAHVNLKSKERDTPNMVLKDADELKKLEALNNKPIMMVVGAEKPTFTLSTKAKVDGFLAQKMKAKKPQRIQNGTETGVLLFDELAKQNTPMQLIQKSTSYGGKGSKLPLLAHEQMVGMGSVLQKKLNFRLTPMGFSIPIQYYFEFVNANPELKAKLELLIQKEMAEKGQVPPTPKERAALVKEIQQLFYTAVMPDSLFALLGPKAAELKKQNADLHPLSPLKKVKVRSSANAEDIPNFDGAGLHSSYGAKIDEPGDPKEPCVIEISQEGVATKEDMKPATLACAIKGVYASLWNKRAIEERNFAKINQHDAGMAIAINGSYDYRDKTEKVDEIANAVVVTRVINSKGVYGYRLSINTDDNLVTNPTPQTQSEVVIASFLTATETPKYSFLQYAKPDPKIEVMTKPLLKPEVYDRMVQIAQAVEMNYCRFNRSYYPAGDCTWVIGDPEKPAALDMEFKLYSNGEVLIKQVREFSGQ